MLATPLLTAPLLLGVSKVSDPMTKNIRLSQESPRDQLLVAIGSIEGNLLNLEAEHCSVERAVCHIRTALKAMKLVMPHIENVAWDPEKPRSEGA